MSRFNFYQTGTSALLASILMAGAAAPLVAPGAASAEPLFRGSTRSTGYQTELSIPYGTDIPVYYDQADKIVVAPNETAPLTLKVARNIRNSRGTLLIPKNSKIVGELQPADGGVRFVATELVLSGNRRLPIDATSDVITQTEDVGRGTDTGSILKGAVVGAGAATAIQAVTGAHHIGLGTTLGGAGLGAVGGLLLGGGKKTRVVVIRPNSDLNLTLRSRLALR
jgi:hypothetical protein